jgi:hypothetical protein
LNPLLISTILITFKLALCITPAVEGSFGALRQPQDDMLRDRSYIGAVVAAVVSGGRPFRKKQVRRTATAAREHRGASTW